MNLCTTNPEWDSCDAFNLAFAISMAKRELGAELQRRGHLTDITYVRSDRLHPEFAGELAAAELNLTQRQLADFRVWDITSWADAFIAAQQAAA